jgi:hypothetical protein
VIENWSGDWIRIRDPCAQGSIHDVSAPVKVRQFVSFMLKSPARERLTGSLGFDYSGRAR